MTCLCYATLLRAWLCASHACLMQLRVVAYGTDLRLPTTLPAVHYRPNSPQETWLWIHACTGQIGGGTVRVQLWVAICVLMDQQLSGHYQDALGGALGGEIRRARIYTLQSLAFLCLRLQGRVKKGSGAPHPPPGRRTFCRRPVPPVDIHWQNF
jgi:hypothetical protein